MRILFLSIEYPPESPDGIGSYVFEIAHALAHRGHEVHVLSCIPGQVERDYRDGQVFLHRRGEARTGTTLSAVGDTDSRPMGRLSLTRTILRHALTCWQETRALGIDFDVIETPDWMAEGLLFALRRQPVVAHMHTPLRVISRFNGSATGTDIRVAARLEWLTVAAARSVTSPSRLLVQTLRDDGLLRRRDVAIIRYPINIERWHDIVPMAATAPVAFFAGRLERLKGPEVLIDAMALVARRCPEAEAWLAGDSTERPDGRSYREWLADRIARSNAPCRLLGHVSRDEIRHLCASARVVVVPSRYDNLPYAGLEGLAAGRPVVCTTATGLTEMMRGSKAGAIVEPDDAVGLADALEPYFSDLDAAIQAGNEARDLAARLCSPDSIAQQREHIYATAMGRKHRE